MHRKSARLCLIVAIIAFAALAANDLSGDPWSILKVPVGQARETSFDSLPSLVRLTIRNTVSTLLRPEYSPFVSESVAIRAVAASKSDEDDVVLFSWFADSTHLRMITSRNVTQFEFTMPTAVRRHDILGALAKYFVLDSLDLRALSEAGSWPRRIADTQCFHIGDTSAICLLRTWKARVDICIDGESIVLLFITKLHTTPCFLDGSVWFEEGDSQPVALSAEETRYHVSASSPRILRGGLNSVDLYRFTVQQIVKELKGIDAVLPPGMDTISVDVQMRIEGDGRCSLISLEGGGTPVSREFSAALKRAIENAVYGPGGKIVETEFTQRVIFTKHE